MRALLIVLFDNTGSQLTTPLQQHLHLQNESLFTAKQLAVKIKCDIRRFPADCLP